ncbi:hypothetical protein [Embleya sp. NPDC005575]|uniref:hypothetical protein n=1 Tax=Embleya sp. NPDC005575 TaxID=3156892 RepID=UPI0033B0F6A2
MNEVQARWAIQRWQDTVGDHLHVHLIPAPADPSAPDSEWRIYLPGDPTARTDVTDDVVKAITPG